MATQKTLKELDIKPTLQVVICQLNKTLDNAHRKGDIIYTEPVSYKIFFEDCTTLITSLYDRSAQINRNTVQTIIIKSVSKPDVEKPMPTDAGLFDIIQKVAREIWDIPNDRLNDFDYAIYPA